MRDLIEDNAIFRIKQNDNGNTNYQLIIPKSVSKLVQQGQRTRVVQIDETYHTHVHGAGILHVVCSTNTNLKHTLGYCFM